MQILQLDFFFFFLTYLSWFVFRTFNKNLDILDRLKLTEHSKTCILLPVFSHLYGYFQAYFEAVKSLFIFKRSIVGAATYRTREQLQVESREVWDSVGFSRMQGKPVLGTCRDRGGTSGIGTGYFSLPAQAASVQEKKQEVKRVSCRTALLHEVRDLAGCGRLQKWPEPCLPRGSPGSHQPPPLALPAPHAGEG